MQGERRLALALVEVGPLERSGTSSGERLEHGELVLAEVVRIGKGEHDPTRAHPSDLERERDHGVVARRFGRVERVVRGDLVDVAHHDGAARAHGVGDGQVVAEPIVDQRCICVGS